MLCEYGVASLVGAVFSINLTKTLDFRPWSKDYTNIKNKKKMLGVENNWTDHWQTVKCRRGFHRYCAILRTLKIAVNLSVAEEYQ